MFGTRFRHLLNRTRRMLFCCSALLGSLATVPLCAQVSQDSIVTVTYPAKRYVSTLNATDIRSNSAVLHGEIITKDSNFLGVCFSYKIGNSQSKTDVEIDSNRNGKFSVFIKNLPANTEITFYAVAKTTLGPKNANSLKFKTLPKIPKLNITITHHATTLEKWSTGFFNSGTFSGAKSQIVKACDYKEAVVLQKARSVAQKSPGSYNFGQICEVFDYCYQNWKYVNDPSGRGENYMFASATITNQLNGDCDDFSILLCSMLLAIGGDARVNLAYTNEGNGHAFTEVNVGQSDMKQIASYIAARYKSAWTGKIHYRIDKDKNCWLNLDWWAKHPGGRYYQADKGTRFYIIDNYCEDY